MAIASMLVAVRWNLGFEDWCDRIDCRAWLTWCSLVGESAVRFCACDRLECAVRWCALVGESAARWWFCAFDRL